MLTLALSQAARRRLSILSHRLACIQRRTRSPLILRDYGCSVDKSLSWQREETRHTRMSTVVPSSVFLSVMFLHSTLGTHCPSVVRMHARAYVRSACAGRDSLVARAVICRSARRRVCARHSDAHLSVCLTQHSGASCPLPCEYCLQSACASCARGAGRSKPAQCVDCAVACVRLPQLCSVCLCVSYTDLLDP
jgi:hypothetical protein